MRSGHVSGGRARLACAAFYALALSGIFVTGACVTRVYAQSPVVVAGVDDAELLSRIRGQTRDLPIALIRADAAALSRPSAAQLQTIARAHDAEFVVHVEQEANGGRVVYVLDVLADELRLRAAPAPQRRHRFARSAAAETIALIVRGELADALAARASQTKPAPSTESTASPNPQSGRASPANTAQTPTDQAQTTRAQTTTKQAAQPSTARAQPPEPKPEQKDEPQPEPEPAQKDEPEREETEELEDTADSGPPSTWFIPTQLSLEVAGRISTPITDRYFFGAALSLRCTFDYISIGLTGGSSLVDRANIQGLTLSLRERAIGFEAFVHLPLPARFSAGLGATGRWLFYQRNAASSDPDWRPEPADTSTTFAVGPQLELRWQLAEPIGVSVRFGLDVLLRPVSWRYRLDTNPRVPVELEHQNRTVPWLSLGVFGSL